MNIETNIINIISNFSRKRNWKYGMGYLSNDINYALDRMELAKIIYKINKYRYVYWFVRIQKLEEKMRIKTNKVVRRKPRDKGESECFFILMKAKIDDNIKKGKVKFMTKAAKTPNALSSMTLRL